MDCLRGLRELQMHVVSADLSFDVVTIACEYTAYFQSWSGRLNNKNTTIKVTKQLIVGFLLTILVQNALV